MIGVSLVLVWLWLMLLAAPSRGANAISAENALPGDPHWFRPAAPETNLDIYASQITLAPGETLQLHISAASRYKVLVYRLGWYQGAGARLIGCVPACDGDNAGSQYPVPPPEPGTGLLDAGWPVTASFRIPITAVSGYYIAEAVATTGSGAGDMRYYPFVVRALPSQTPSHILVQIPVNTWEAYNEWGGKSLYAFNSTNKVPAVKVSFSRPFENLREPDSYQLVRFLEQAGYDMTYTTDVDTDRSQGELLRHRLVIVDGHDEYWTKGMYDAFDGARTAGVNLVAFGADIASWQNRYEDNDRTIVEYRSATADPEPDPALKTVEFQRLEPPRPQCELFGVEYHGGFDGVIPPIGLPRDYTVTQAAAKSPWFEGTGLVPGTVLPGLVGYEWDTIMPGCNVPPLTDLFHWSGAINADSTVYTAPSGARVFAAGSLDFATGLDQWPRNGQGVENQGLRRFALNMLTDLGGELLTTRSELFAERAAGPGQVARGPLRRITALRISPSRFRAALRGATVARDGPVRTCAARRRTIPICATVTYKDTRAGKATFTIARYLHRCTHATRAVAHSCLRQLSRVAFVRTDRIGANGFRLTGRLDGRRLAPGRYLLTATPGSDPAARGSRSVSFQILQ
jgi:hypothetical protein